MKPETWLDTHAEHAPDRPAVIADDRILDFATLREEVRAVALGLIGEGIGPGTRVRVSFEPGLDYVLVVHALLLLGATSCPVDPRDPRSVSDYDLSLESSADIPRGFGHELPGHATDPTTTVCEITSSGTTGIPKSVSLSAGNVFWSAIGSAHALGVEPDDRWLVCLPLFHVSGLMPLYRALIYGTAVTIHADFAASRVAAELAGGEVSGVSLVPTALRDLIAADSGALRQPRTVLTGGAATPTALIEEAIEAGIPVCVTYGLTEATSQVTVLSTSEVPEAIGSVGRPLVTSRVKIDQGEVLVGGPTVATGCRERDGWLRTGDRGRIDSDGRLWIEGRVDEMIITGGENVFPAEVESVLSSHPSVKEAVAYGVDDARWQQELRAAVVLEDGARFDPEALREWCGMELPPYKVPKLLESIDEIPLGPSGKPRRTELAKRSSSQPR